MNKRIEFALLERIPNTRLRYVAETKRIHPKRRRALFLCDCDNVIDTDLNWVRFGYVTSCGCFKSEVVSIKNTKHNHAVRNNQTGAYRSWQAMHQRVLVNPNYLKIKICDRWSGDKGFENFFKDMGERPAKHSIERINNNGHYEPSNCKWATQIEQAQNTKQTVLITINGETLSINEWCRRKGIWYGLIKQRRRKGWDIVSAIMTPPNPNKSHKRKMMQ